MTPAASHTASRFSTNLARGNRRHPWPAPSPLRRRPDGAYGRDRLIISVFGEEIEQLQGEVEADETYVGGKEKGKRGRPGKESNKTPVFGIVERGGKVAALVTEDASKATLQPIIREHVMPRSMIYTDEWVAYNGLDGKKEYEHKRIFHAEKVYIVGNVHTNTIEGFWSQLKRSIDGAKHSVSAKHLQDYVNEYAFRYNHRDDEQAMYATITERVTKVPHGKHGKYRAPGLEKD